MSETAIWEKLIDACERNPMDEAAIARLEAHAADIHSTRLRMTGIAFREAFRARKRGGMTP